MPNNEKWCINTSMKTADVVQLLQDLKGKDGHTKTCSFEMTMGGEPCWCGTSFNPVMSNKGMKIDSVRIDEAIAFLTRRKRATKK